MRRFLKILCVLLGIGMLAGAALIMVSWQRGIGTWEAKNRTYVDTLYTLIPEPQGAVPEERRDNTMSVLSLDGTDFIGILEMPRHSSSLPVCGTWGNINKYPCRLQGSVYDRSIRIGATSQTGQFDFYREISVGDSVYFTDMEGNRFSYTVTDVRYEKHADETAFLREASDLILFVKNLYGFEYILIYCQMAN